MDAKGSKWGQHLMHTADKKTITNSQNWLKPAMWTTGLKVIV